MAYSLSIQCFYCTARGLQSSNRGLFTAGFGKGLLII